MSLELPKYGVVVQDIMLGSLIEGLLLVCLGLVALALVGVVELVKPNVDYLYKVAREYCQAIVKNVEREEGEGESLCEVVEVVEVADTTVVILR